MPVELVFDEGFGRLFVVRVAGNVAGDDERGSIEYAVNHLHVPLIVVLGHGQCGAVTAALGSEADRKAESADIQTILGRIEPALKEVPGDASAADRLHQAVEANVRQQLRTAPGFQDRINRGELDIVGGSMSSRPDGSNGSTGEDSVSGSGLNLDQLRVLTHRR